MFSGSPVPDNPQTLAAVRDAIRARGPLTFSDFMEIALYDPRHGYYRRPRIGRDGDFMTAVSAGPVWGRIWARCFRRLLSGAAAPGTVHEFGGNTGRFRDDVLAECPDLNYRIIEAGDPPPERMEGVVFSNELIDALPFHRIRVRGGRPREVFVGLDDRGGLREFEGDPSPAALADAPESADLIPEDAEFELRPRAQSWIRDIAARLARGHVITVDYGLTRAEYFAKPRPNGTWRTYSRHARTDSALAGVGEQDITADVDFTSFIAAGEAAGLETVLFTDQTRALLEIGRDVIEEISTRDAGEFSRDRNAIHQLLHPSLMGRRFRVLMQRTKPRPGP